MRALMFFYLVNLFGEIPVVTGTDYKINSILGRSATSHVYQQIIEDLDEAQNLLSEKYLDGSLQSYSGLPDRTRPTKWSAIALLARAYLYNNDFTNADIKSSEIISHTELFNLTELNGVFLKNSDEAIWQLQPVNGGRNTEDAFTFIIPLTGPGNNSPVTINPELLNNFETGDARKKDWVNNIALGNDTFIYPFKYKKCSAGCTCDRIFDGITFSRTILDTSRSKD